MFNKTTVENSLFGIVGAEQPLNPDYAIIDVANQGSTSGYLVTDLPMVKVEYYKDTQDYEALTDAEFNTLLTKKQKTAITSICNQVFSTEDFRDRNLFYRNANNNVEAEVLNDGFVGFKIEVTPEKSVAFEITRVILDFQGNYGNDIVLQLYNSGDPNPIQSQTITITEQHQVEELNWVVDNSGDTYKGEYYLGYIKSATTPIPFKREYNGSNILSTIESLAIRGIEVPNHTGNVLFDLEDVDGLGENTGLNPDVFTYDDYTDFIIHNKRLFARAIQLEMGINMLQEASASLRVNRNQRSNEDDVVAMIQTLEGIDAGNGKLRAVGLVEKLASEITQIKVEAEKLRKGYLGGRIMVNTLT